MFGSILGLWAIHSLDPGSDTPGSVRDGLILMAWVWPFPQTLCHPYPSRLTVAQRLCGCLGVPVPSLEVLPGHRGTTIASSGYVGDVFLIVVPSFQMTLACAELT